MADIARGQQGRTKQKHANPIPSTTRAGRHHSQARSLSLTGVVGWAGQAHCDLHLRTQRSPVYVTQ